MDSEARMKASYYFDESGDPQILGRRGINLLEKGMVSKVFMVGYLETKSPKEFTRALNSLRAELANDEKHCTNISFQNYLKTA